MTSLVKKVTKDWGDYKPLPSTLEYYGKIFSDRFMDELQSPLHKAQRGALLSLVTWFGRRETEDFTAVVVMPTGTGKTGVICCLPFAIGGAIEKGEISPNTINMDKPILIIAPGLSILDQLEINLLNDPFLKKMGILTSEKDLHNNYTVHTVRST